jgi:hypothetical protein
MAQQLLQDRPDRTLYCMKWLLCIAHPARMHEGPMQI